jgi:outer membrane protein TolC
MTSRAVTLAAQRLDLATAAARQSREAHRLVEKRYAGGLATIAELLGAETAATGASLAQAAARYALIDALAQQRRAIGADPGALAQLDAATAMPSDSRNEDPTS